MKLVFRKIGPDEVEKEVTQRDQFNSDEVGLIEALIREAHQNSLDAREPNASGPVRTRIAFHECDGVARDFLRPLFEDLVPHLIACGIETDDIDFDSPRFLVIEDFGTTGLRGARDRKDDQPFSDFWRRMGRSHKGGQQGGRWGLGKLVFSGASEIRTFFGLTISTDHPNTPALLGQAVLSTHPGETGEDLDAHGFYCQPGPGGIQLPVTDPNVVAQFARASGISRRHEPGLSIAIPFIRGITQEALICELVRNYFFPILVGQLECRIGDVQINASSFDELARAHGGPQLRDGRLIAFIRALRVAMNEPPDLVLPDNWTSGLSKVIEEADVHTLRERYARDQLIHVRAPVHLKRRKGVGMDSHFDLFLRPADGEGHALVVRGAITLPSEARDFRSRFAFGALIARDPVIVEFLGDAENPAHTRWNGNAEKLARNWVNPGARLREIRGSLNALADLITQSIEEVEPNAFIDILSVPGPTGPAVSKTRNRPDGSDSGMPAIAHAVRLFSIEERRGGFAVRGTPALSTSDLPLEIRITAAYDIIRGNPFRKYSPLDFDFQTNRLTVTAQGALAEATGPNTMRIVVRDPRFSVAVHGFDQNRDLVVRAAR